MNNPFIKSREIDLIWRWPVLFKIFWPTVHKNGTWSYEMRLHGLWSSSILYYYATIPIRPLGQYLYLLCSLLHGCCWWCWCLCAFVEISKIILCFATDSTSRRCRTLCSRWPRWERFLIRSHLIFFSSSKFFYLQGKGKFLGIFLVV